MLGQGGFCDHLAAEAVIGVGDGGRVVGVGDAGELSEGVIAVGGDGAAFPGAGGEFAVGGVGVGWALVIGSQKLFPIA